MRNKRQHFKAGVAAKKGKWNLKGLVPVHVEKAGNRSAFLRELLAYADISSEEKRIAELFLEGFGVRKVSEILGKHRREIQARQRRVYEALEELIQANPVWVQNFQPGDRKKTAFVINRNRRKITARQEPHLYRETPAHAGSHRRAADVVGQESPSLCRRSIPQALGTVREIDQAMDKRMLNLKELAYYIGLAPQTVKNQFYAGEFFIPAVKIGRRLLWDKRLVDKCLDRLHKIDC